MPFVNAVMLFGKAEPRSLGIFNLFVGLPQAVAPFYIIATAEDRAVILNASGLFFILLAPKRKISRFTAWVTIVEARIACVVPAYLLLTGVLPSGG